MRIGKNFLYLAAALFLGLGSAAGANAQEPANGRAVKTMLVTARVVATCRMSVQVSRAGSGERNQGGAGSFKVECTKGASVGLAERGEPGASGLRIASRTSEVPLDGDDGAAGRRVATVLF
jgi:hypothetical protein